MIETILVVITRYDCNALSYVLGYKGKSGAVPQKVLAYYLFCVSPDFFPPYKKMPRHEFV